MIRPNVRPFTEKPYNAQPLSRRAPMSNPGLETKLLQYLEQFTIDRDSYDSQVPRPVEGI